MPTRWISPASHRITRRVTAWEPGPRCPTCDARGCEAEVDWILRHSFPMRSTAELSQQIARSRLSAGGGQHQRARSHRGNPGRDLVFHQRPGSGHPAAAMFLSRYAGDPGAVITFEFDGQPQLGGYSVWTASDTAVSSATAKVSRWRCLARCFGIATDHRCGPRAAINAHLASAARSRPAATAAAVAATATTGWSRQRDTAPPDRSRQLLADRRRHYRNADRVVHLYNYLLAGALQAAVRDADEPDTGRHPGHRRTRTRRTIPGANPVDAQRHRRTRVGRRRRLGLHGVVQPGTDFYLRPAPGTSATTLTATTPQSSPGRVLTGVALEEAPQRFTPVADLPTT